MDAILQVVSADGFVLEENNDYHGLDPQIAFTAQEGRHLHRSRFAFPAQPDSSIRFFGSDACIYRLTLTTGRIRGLPDSAGGETRTVRGWLKREGWNLTPESRKLSVAAGTLKIRSRLCSVQTVAKPLRFVRNRIGSTDSRSRNC